MDLVSHFHLRFSLIKPHINDVSLPLPARLIEIACSPAPEGHSRWTLRLLEEQAKVVLDTPVGKNAIGRALKKTNFDLTKTTTGASPQKKMQNL